MRQFATEREGRRQPGRKFHCAQMQQTMTVAAFKCLRDASGGWQWQIGGAWKMLQMHSPRWRYCEVENDGGVVRPGRRRSSDIRLARHGVVMVNDIDPYRSFRRRILFITGFNFIAPCGVYYRPGEIQSQASRQGCRRCRRARRITIYAFREKTIGYWTYWTLGQPDFSPQLPQPTSTAAWHSDC